MKKYIRKSVMLKDKKINLFKFSFIFLGLLLLHSCNDGEIFKTEIKFEEGKWAYTNALKGTLEIKDTSQTYDLILNLSHMNNYPFQNIYLRITDDFTGILKSDTVNIDLSDDYGVWKGKSKAGDKSIETILRKKFKFHETKNYNFSIEQFSRNDTLNGIKKVIFLISKSK